MSGTADMAHELAVFLRTRRERLAPGDVGLPLRRQRRTPGLRREEVAELAGVSVDYVTRLEQGRGLRPSPAVLDALAGALRLSEDERAYLFNLAEQRPTTRPRKAAEPAPSLARLIRDLSPLPAMLLNHRFDIIAWNPEMAALMVDFGTLPEEQRNTIWLCIMHPAFCDFYRDRDQVIREGIAGLRAAWAEHPDDAALAELIHDLTAKSAEFAHFWALRDVTSNGRGRKRLRHDAGPLTIDFEVLAPIQDPDQELVIYRAADAASQAALDGIIRTAREAGSGGKLRAS